MILSDGGSTIFFMRVLYLIVTLLYLTDLFFMVPKYTKCKYDHTPRKKKLMWKGACIGVPVIAIIAGTIFNASKGFVVGDFLLVAGMCVCAAGDIVLEIKFIKGGFLFFFGHVLYIAAICTITTTSSTRRNTCSIPNSRCWTRACPPKTCMRFSATGTGSAPTWNPCLPWKRASSPWTS